MIQLNESQMRAFCGVAIENFVERGLRHLRSCLPDRTLAYSDDQLRQRLRNCLDRAQHYSLFTERQVIAFTDVTFLLGEFFDTDRRFPWPAALLQSPNVDGDAKARSLLSLAQLHAPCRRPKRRGSQVGG